MVDAISSGGNSQEIQKMQQQFRMGQKPKPEDMFSNILKDCESAGIDVSNGLTKEALEKLKEQIENGGDADKGKLGAINDFLDKFDSISSDGKTISESDFVKAFENGILQPPKGGHRPPLEQSSNIDNIQDPQTITSDQLLSPIDITI